MPGVTRRICPHIGLLECATSHQLCTHINAANHAAAENGRDYRLMDRDMLLHGRLSLPFSFVCPCNQLSLVKIVSPGLRCMDLTLPAGVEVAACKPARCRIWRRRGMAPARVQARARGCIFGRQVVCTRHICRRRSLLRCSHTEPSWHAPKKPQSTCLHEFHVGGGAGGGHVPGTAQPPEGSCAHCWQLPGQTPSRIVPVRTTAALRTPMVRDSKQAVAGRRKTVPYRGGRRPPYPGRNRNQLP